MMFEPLLLTEEEAQWPPSCGWHVDESAVVVALVFRRVFGWRCLRLTAEDHLCDDEGNCQDGQQKANQPNCHSGFDFSLLVSFMRSLNGGLLAVSAFCWQAFVRLLEPLTLNFFLLSFRCSDGAM